MLTGEGGACVMLVGPSFARLVEVAFTQIRHYGAGDLMVALHLLGTLQGVAERVSAEQRVVLEAQAEALVMEAHQSLRVVSDIQRVEEAAAWSRAPGRWPLS
jgi:uncharacterized membrane protein